MNDNRVVINELTFSQLLELGRIAIEKCDVPKEIIEKTLKRIALENELSSTFVCWY